MRNKKQEEQAKKEKEIFLNFIKISGLNIKLESIIQPDPPAPDILCSFKGKGNVAFEITEIIDKDFAWGMNKKGLLLQGLYDQYKKSTPYLKPTLKSNCILVDFKKNISYRNCNNSIVRIFEALKEIDETFIGDMPCKLIKKYSLPVNYIYIDRSQCNGLLFDISGNFFVGNPTQERISNKFEKSKKYETQYPIELLVYYELQPDFPYQTLTDFQEFVSNKWDTHRFRRIWVYNIKKQTVDFFEK